MNAKFKFIHLTYWPGDIRIQMVKINTLNNKFNYVESTVTMSLQDFWDMFDVNKIVLHVANNDEEREEVMKKFLKNG